MSTDKDLSRYHEMIDACRPGSGDEGLPEMAPLAERLANDPQLRRRYEESQALDGVIREAIGRVLVPEGIADRILQAIDAEDAATDESTSGGIISDAQPEKTVDIAPAPRGHRRFWMLGLSCAAAASAIVALVLWNRVPEHDLTSARGVAAQVMHWQTNLDQQSWRPDEFPFSIFKPSTQLRLRPRRWQRITARTARGQVACYDLTAPRQPRVYLYVLLKQPQFQGASLPPAMPDRDTRDWCFGVWQEGGTVYAVAVEGNKDRYDQVVRATLKFA